MVTTMYIYVYFRYLYFKKINSYSYRLDRLPLFCSVPALLRTYLPTYLPGAGAGPSTYLPTFEVTRLHGADLPWYMYYDTLGRG